MGEITATVTDLYEPHWTLKTVNTDVSKGNKFEFESKVVQFDWVRVPRSRFIFFCFFGVREICFADVFIWLFRGIVTFFTS